MWRVFSLAAPAFSASHLPADCSTLADEYPFSVRAERPLSPADLVAMQRDHYEGTPYDMTQGLASGPFGDPSRFDLAGNRAVYAALDQGDSAALVGGARSTRGNEWGGAKPQPAPPPRARQGQCNCSQP